MYDINNTGCIDNKEIITMVAILYFLPKDFKDLKWKKVVGSLNYPKQSKQKILKRI